jgi:hypothetical protein
MKMDNLNRLDKELIKADKMNTDTIHGVLAEMATENVPTADYDGIRDKLFSSKRKPAFSRRYIQLAATAACAAVIMLCVWTIPGLFNTPNNPDKIVADGNTIIPGEPDESFGTGSGIPSDADTVIPGLPDEVFPDEERIEPGSMFVFTNAFESLLELHTLLEQSDETITEYLSSHPDYSMNGLLTRLDIESLFALIDKSQFPFMEGVRDYEVLVVPEAKRVYSRFVVDGIEYGFTSEYFENLQDIIAYEEAEDNIELLHTEDNISLYFLTSHANPDDNLFPFIMDIRGVYVHVLVRNAGDLQTAVDGILAFGFGSLILE